MPPRHIMRHSLLEDFTPCQRHLRWLFRPLAMHFRHERAPAGAADATPRAIFPRRAMLIAMPLTYFAIRYFAISRCHFLFSPPLFSPLCHFAIQRFLFRCLPLFSLTPLRHYAITPPRRCRFHIFMPPAIIFIFDAFILFITPPAAVFITAIFIAADALR